jgi:hypothetical protein
MQREVLKVRRYKAGYEVRTERITGKDAGLPDGESITLQSAYTPTGDYIGDPRMAYRLVVKRGIAPEYRTSHSQTCSIGYSAKDKKWYGWSHRGICGFGIGDKLFDPEWGDDAATDTMPFVERGSVTIETMDQAKQAAANFAEYVN